MNFDEKLREKEKESGEVGDEWGSWGGGVWGSDGGGVWGSGGGGAWGSTEVVVDEKLREKEEESSAELKKDEVEELEALQFEGLRIEHVEVHERRDEHIAPPRLSSSLLHPTHIPEGTTIATPITTQPATYLGNPTREDVAELMTKSSLSTDFLIVSDSKFLASHAKPSSLLV